MNLCNVPITPSVVKMREPSFFSYSNVPKTYHHEFSVTNVCSFAPIEIRISEFGSLNMSCCDTG